MRENRLQVNCIKFCKSEGIFYTVSGTDLYVCIREKLFAFRFGEDNDKSDKRLKKSGGRLYRPPTLEDFVNEIRHIQEGENG